MGLFKKKQEPVWPDFPSDRFEPVIRSSICTGEKTACMRELATGKLKEVMLIRNDSDLEEFCRFYHVSKDQLKTVY